MEKNLINSVGFYMMTTLVVKGLSKYHAMKLSDSEKATLQF